MARRRTNSAAYSNRVYQKSGYRCFYTGLKVKKKGKKGTHKASVEHLISLSIFDNKKFNRLKKKKPELINIIHQFRRDNSVASTTWINSMIGNAPLIVKYDLRNHLQNIIVPQGSSLKQERTIYSDTALKFLRSYCPEGKHWNYPWQWQTQNSRNGSTPTDTNYPFKSRYYNAKRQNILKQIYMDLLTKEEKLLLDYS